MTRKLATLIAIALAALLLASACGGGGGGGAPAGKIAFTSDRDGNYEIYNTTIYVMDADGSGRTRLTDNPASDRPTAWAPAP